MAYTYNDIRIFVQTWEGDKSRIIARIQPIEGGTHLQHFGFEDEVITITAIIVGDTDLEALLALFESSGTYYAMDVDEVSIGNYYPKSFNYSRILTTAQTIRQDLDCTAPVYNIQMELYPA